MSGRLSLVVFANMESRIIHIGATALHVGVTGHGPDVVVLTGGPGCVQYLERDEIAPRNHRAWYPEPRGVAARAAARTPWKKRSPILKASAKRSVLPPGSWWAIRGVVISQCATRLNIRRPWPCQRRAKTDPFLLIEN